MADLHIRRNHPFTLDQARALCGRWAEQAQREYGLSCTHTAGADADRVTFSRPGVQGELCVSANAFELHAKLGFLLSAFLPRIEAEVTKNLDALLGGQPKPPAPEGAVNRREGA
jgi:putative polyhydroxyalkanoate system protein